MLKILQREEINDLNQVLEENIRNYLFESTAESFASFENFQVISFDWYDIDSQDTQTYKITIYKDQENLFFIAQSEKALRLLQKQAIIFK